MPNFTLTNSTVSTLLTKIVFLTKAVRTCYAFTMLNELINLLVVGEYSYDITNTPLTQTPTRGMWQGESVVTIDGQETIHGNGIRIRFSTLYVGSKAIAEDITFYAHGFSIRVSADKFWEELRKHI